MVGKLTKAVFGAALCLGAVDGQFNTTPDTACRMNATDLQQRCFPNNQDQPCAEMDKLTLEDVKGNGTAVKAACEAICNARQNCKAIEYMAKDGNCEIWNVDIPALKEGAPGYTCATYTGANKKSDTKIYVQLDMEMSSKNWTEGLQSANLTSYEDFTRGLALLLFNTLKSTTNPILNAGVSKLNPGQIDFGLEKKNETFAMSFVFEENVEVKDVNILAVHILLADRDLDTVKSLKSNLVDGIKALMGMADKDVKLDSYSRKIVFEKPVLGNPLQVLSEFLPSSDKESSSYFNNGFFSFLAASMMAAFAW